MLGKLDKIKPEEPLFLSCHLEDITNLDLQSLPQNVVQTVDVPFRPKCTDSCTIRRSVSEYHKNVSPHFLDPVGMYCTHLWPPQV
jgi:hypothetical protein